MENLTINSGYFIAPGLPKNINKLITAARIVNEVAVVYKTTSYKIKANLKSKSRPNPEMRHLIVFFAHEYLKGYNLSEIGAIVKKDHATVLHSIQTVQDWLVTSPEFKLNYTTVKERLEIHK